MNRTHITQLIVDLAGMDVVLKVREADPFVEILPVVDLTDFGLCFPGSNDFHHIGSNVNLSLVLFIVLSVQTLQRKFET